MKKLIYLGILQSLGIAFYCLLISLLFNFLQDYFKSPNQLMIMIFMLTMLVVSTGITGVLFFGYPAYLIMKQRTKQGLIVLTSTVITLLVIIFIILAIMQAIK